jgi:SAM-dependent methyltransferase
MNDKLSLYCCPKCQADLEQRNKLVFCGNSQCTNSNTPFYNIDNLLILVDFPNSVINIDTLLITKASSLVKRITKFSRITRIVKKLLNGTNKVSSNNFEFCVKLLREIKNPRILIIGGGTIGAGIETIIKNFPDGIISFDVYNSNNIDFIADAHSIPLIDESIDLVIVQAVLEHVLSPMAVVNECHRVLKNGGYVYSETPFLQHVHEGKYDFTRFTVLGHRLLFKSFNEIKSGYVGGLGQSLLWAIEYFVAGVFRSRIAGKIAKACLIWIRWVEYLIPHNWNIDGACGAFFLGKKTMSETEQNINSLLDGYKGAQK